MRKNPYLKQEQEYTPLVMRGSFNTTLVISPKNQATKNKLIAESQIEMEEYPLYKDIGFSMVKLPFKSYTLKIPSGASGIAISRNLCTQDLFYLMTGFNPSYYFQDIDLDNNEKTPKKPVENVNLYDCVVFCNQLSSMFGLAPYYGIENAERPYRNPIRIRSADISILGGYGFRLPTLAEYKAVLRIPFEQGHTRRFEDCAWFTVNSGRETHPVGEKEPNMVGLYDVLGNVEIWVNKDDSNVFGIVGLHYDSRYPGIASGDMQAYLRGGESSDYFDSVDYITNRIIEDTFVDVLESSRYTIAGFRFVRSVDPNESKAVTDDYEDDDDTSYSESDDE